MIGSRRSIALLLALSLALMIPAVAVAESDTVEISATLKQPGAGVVDAGPGYWWFRLLESHPHTRQVTYTISVECSQAPIWSITIPIVGAPLGDYVGSTVPALNPIPAPPDDGPGGYCVRVDVVGKKKAGATAEVIFPHRPTHGEPDVWAFVQPGGGGGFSPDGSVTWDLEGFAHHADGSPASPITWTAGSQSGSGKTFSPTLVPGVHTITAGFNGAVDTLSLTVLNIVVTVTVDDSVPYRNRQEVPIDITVTDGSNPLPGMDVDVDVFTPKGGWITYQQTTDASGSATVTHRVRLGPDGSGTYAVRAAVISENDAWLPTVRGYGISDTAFFNAGR